jgi:hypothetical protein
MNGGIYKWLTMFLAGWIVTIGIAITASWLTWGSNSVNKSDVQSLIEEFSPYAKERSFIMERIDRNTTDLDRMDARVQKNSDLISNDIREILDRLTRIESLVGAGVTSSASAKVR